MEFVWKNGKVIAQSNQTCWIFENVDTVSRKTKDGSSIYCETLSNFAEERVPITVSWQRYSPNMVFMQDYKESEDSYFV